MGKGEAVFVQDRGNGVCDGTVGEIHKCLQIPFFSIFFFLVLFGEVSCFAECFVVVVAVWGFYFIFFIYSLSFLFFFFLRGGGGVESFGKAEPRQI